MKTYFGGCHCGKIRFSVSTEIKKVVSCNCSICIKKGVLHHRVSPAQFKFLQGEGYLSLYQFDSKEAKHYFCKVCGIHSFSHPRAAPNMISINIRCLEDYDLEKEEYELIQFDGRNWETSVAKLNEQVNRDK